MLGPPWPPPVVPASTGRVEDPPACPPPVVPNDPNTYYLKFILIKRGTFQPGVVVFGVRVDGGLLICTINVAMRLIFSLFFLILSLLALILSLIVTLSSSFSVFTALTLTLTYRRKKKLET